MRHRIDCLEPLRIIQLAIIPVGCYVNWLEEGTPRHLVFGRAELLSSPHGLKLGHEDVIRHVKVRANQLSEGQQQLALF